LPDPPAGKPATPTSGKTVALIVIAAVVGVLLLLTFIVAMVDAMGHSAVDQFDQVGYCVHHAKDPACGFPSP
jgi:hypothetical protein